MNQIIRGHSTETIQNNIQHVQSLSKTTLHKWIDNGKKS